MTEHSEAGPLVPSPEDGRAVPAPRRYADDEVAEILRRAAVVESRPDTVDGTTLMELMSAASDAGIDPAEVRRAAALTAPTESGAARMLLGAPDRRVQRAFLPDASLPAAPEQLVRVTEQALRCAGEITAHTEHTLRWRAQDGSVGLELRAVADGVELRLVADRARGYLAHWFGGVVVWALLAALTPLGVTLGLPATLIGFVVAPPLLARPLWVRSDRTTRLELERVAMDVLRAVDTPSQR